MNEADGDRPGAWALAVRAGVGFAQGLALYGLYHWRKHLDPVAFGAATTAAWLGPVVFLGAFRALSRRTLVLWFVAAVALAAALGGYDAFVHAGEPWMGAPVASSAVFFIATTLYILHHLIVPAAAAGRWRADYERYFDEAWMGAVRLALSALFVGLLWALLWLGASLFGLIGLSFLRDLIAKDWFAYPATTTFFALGVHLTDVRVPLVRGARLLLLTLLSWLLTVLTVIAVAFLAALPFAGLKALSAAGSASGTMLAVCAALIVLINATYQDGERDGYPPLILKWCARAAALALVPLIGVAFYGLGLRIEEYGLTPHRITLGAGLLIAACYAVGYAWAATRRGRWLASLEGTNWLTGQATTVLLLVLLSPLADPMRLSVASQLGRLQSGAVAPASFDYVFLRFHTGRWGREALKRMAAMKGSPRASEFASRAKSVQTRNSPWDSVDEAVPAPQRRISNRLRVYPAGARVPATFLQQAAKSDLGGHSSCFNLGAAELCDAYVLDIYGDGTAAILLVAPGERSETRIAGEAFRREAGGAWRKSGELVVTCPASISALQRGAFSFAAPKARDLVLAGRQFNLSSEPEQNCSTDKLASRAVR